MKLHPIGHIRSTLTNAATPPKQGSEGAPDAWLEVHPRDDPRNPLTGAFATRSPDRPNPLRLHRVTVREMSGLPAHRSHRSG
jgi:tRNA (Thr-GGU) A37 N-methylase